MHGRYLNLADTHKVLCDYQGLAALSSFALVKKGEKGFECLYIEKCGPEVIFINAHENERGESLTYISGGGNEPHRAHATNPHPQSSNNNKNNK